MRRIIATLGLAAALGLLAPAGAAADWAPVQSAALNSQTADYGFSTTGLNATPYVAWVQGAQGSEVVDADGVSASGAYALGGAVGDCDGSPQLAAVGSALQLACQGQVDNDGAQVFGWTGSAWTEVAPDLPGAQNDGFGAVGGDPALLVAAAGTGALSLERWSGSAWTTVGGTLLRHSGDEDGGAMLLPDGATPVVVWSETDAAGTDSVYADQLQGSTWAALNGGASLLPQAAFDQDADVDGAAVIGDVPYVSLDEQESASTFRAYVFSLQGTTLSIVGGGPLITGDVSTPLVRLGADDGTPVALYTGDDIADDPALDAATLSAGGWTALGSPLGIPPLPTSGDPYAGYGLADDGANTPYAGFDEQQGSTENAYDVFVESETAAGVNPNATAGLGVAPVTSTQSSSGTTTSAAISTAGVLQRVAAAALIRHGHLLTLRTGVLAICPAQSGDPRCRATIRIVIEHRRHRRRLTRRVTLRSGAQAQLAVRLPRSTPRGATISARVALTGPNGATTTMAANPARTRR